jgi:hypothetical protein
MADPITMAIATAVAGKAAESMTDQARKCLAALVRRIKDKFRDRPAGQAALEAAQRDPGSGALAGELARALDEASAEDPEFGTQLRELWDRVGLRAAAGDQGVVNVFHGRAGKVVQLRDVHGDLSIG